MRSHMSSWLRTVVLSSLVALPFMISTAKAQTAYYPQAGGSGTWSGYGPVSPWAGYAPGSGWTGYVPGTPAGAVAQPPGTMAPGATIPSVVSGNYPVTYGPATGYVVQPSVVGRRYLLNGVTNPVRGPTPYADGRPRTYYEYGSGRQVRLAKPWLPGAPR